jgi:hypothetical protein
MIIHSKGVQQTPNWGKLREFGVITVLLDGSDVILLPRLQVGWSSCPIK